jgi:hypothetical protein
MSVSHLQSQAGIISLGFRFLGTRLCFPEDSSYQAVPVPIEPLSAWGVRGIPHPMRSMAQNAALEANPRLVVGNLEKDPVLICHMLAILVSVGASVPPEGSAQSQGFDFYPFRVASFNLGENSEEGYRFDDHLPETVGRNRRSSYFSLGRAPTPQ